MKARHKQATIKFGSKRMVEWEKNVRENWKKTIQNEEDRKF